MTAGSLTLAKIEEALEQGPYAWPGGYPRYFIASDGEAMSFDAVKANLAEIRDAHERNDRTGGWLLVAIDINWEDEDLYCAHTGERIKCAYVAA